MLRVTEAVGKSCDQFALFLDHPKQFSKIVDDKLSLRGWFVSKAKNSRLYVSNGKGLRIPLRLCEARPKVKDYYPGFYHVDMPGFELNINVSHEGALEIFEIDGANNEAKVGEIVLARAENEEAKILYVHVAKTAGSTINKYIASQFAKGESLVHIESEDICSVKGRSLLRKKRYISGHLRFDHFKQLVDVRDYFKIITLRDPVDHIISHLNWIRHFSKVGYEKELNRHPEYVIELSRELIDLAFVSPNKVAAFVDGLSGMKLQLLNNTQMSYLLPIECRNNYCEKEFLYAVNALDQFDLVGLTENLGRFTEALSKKFSWPVLQANKKINAIENQTGLTRYAEDTIKQLMPLIEWDIKLYEYALRKFSL